MKIHTYEVEVYVRFNAMDCQIFNVTVKLFETNKDKAIKTAKSKVITQLKKKQKEFKMIRLVWIDYKGYEEKTVYDCFADLKQKEVSKNVIMKMMKITYHEYCYFNNYYEGKTRKLTYEKYKELSRLMNDEKIRRKFQIPKSEFLKFLESHK
ncbi:MULTISPECIES: hypothetical protein [Listeria]|uniref:hypothetical protein n=1 Tax=Listeria TaxID=1637 RepID=UPI000B593222|nr:MULTISPECIES: hypothetical protein [Listeria]